MAIPSRFTPLEVLPSRTANSLPTSLRISTTPIYYKALLIRLLTGTLDFECVLTSQVINQHNNYSTLTYTPNSKASKRLIEQAVSSSISTLDKHIKATVNQNRSFYKELFYEYCNYFYQRQLGNSLNAFLHLYRILERMAYCFPLLWAARATNYEKTFDQLKSYFSNPKIGELGVFKKFIHDSVDSSFRQTPVSLQINSAHPQWQESHYKSLLQNLDQNFVISEAKYSSMTIQFEAILELVINIRNKYFHALTGSANNFNSDQIVDSNEFFLCINETVANWLSFILFQILDYEMS